MSFEAGYSNFLSIPSPYLSIPKIVSFYIFLYRSIFIYLHLHQSTSICCMSIYIPLSYLHLSVTLSFYPLVYSNDAYALFVSQSFWTDQSVSKVHQLFIEPLSFLAACVPVDSLVVPTCQLSNKRGGIPQNCHYNNKTHD